MSPTVAPSQTETRRGLPKYFREIWLAQTLSAAGDRLFFAAVVWFASAQHGVLVGVVGIGLAQFLPTAVLAPFTGVLVDRLPRHLVLLGTDLVRFGVSLALAVVFGLWGVAIPVLLVAVVILRVTGLMFQPALQSLLGRVARSEGELMHLDAWILASGMVAGLFGPALAGVAVAVGAATALVINAVTFLVSAMAIQRARPLLQDAHARSGLTIRNAAAGWFGAARQGLATAQGDLVVRRVGPTLPIVDMAGTGVALILPAVLIASHHASWLWYGVLTGAWAAGRFIGLFAARRFLVGTRKGALLAVNALLQGAAIVGVSAVINPAWMAVFFLALGIPSGSASVCVSSYIQTKIPDEVRGRVFSFLGAVVAIAMPLGPVLSGVLASLTSARVAILVLGLILAAVGLWPLSSRSLWRIQ